MAGFRVAVLGATGAVGAEMLRVLEQRNFPVAELVPLASPRSAGKTVTFRGEPLEVRAVDERSFDGIDLVLMSAGAARSRRWAPVARQAGALVVDNSSAFRMEPDVPLVVPEVNAEALERHDGLVANPNCAAAILVMALAPLRSLGRIERVVVSTYQSASGAGARAIDELFAQTRGYLEGDEPAPQVFQWPIAFNLFSHNAAVGHDGYNGEEAKLMAETRKILGRPDLRIAATCVRVPTVRAHAESVEVQFDRPVDLDAARSAIEAFDGVTLRDDREHNHFPMPREVSGCDEVYVGRLRHEPGHPEVLEMFVAGDQLRKGAALNAVQIAERLVGPAR